MKGKFSPSSTYKRLAWPGWPHHSWRRQQPWLSPRGAAPDPTIWTFPHRV